MHSSSFKYMKRTEVSREIHTLYVFNQKSTGQKEFRVRDTCITVPRQTKYCQAKRLCQTKHIILLHFLANKPRRELSGSTKKRKTFCTQVFFVLPVRMQNRDQQDKAQQEIITFIQSVLFAQLLEETDYEKRQTSMIKTTVLQFMLEVP